MANGSMPPEETPGRVHPAAQIEEKTKKLRGTMEEALNMLEEIADQLEASGVLPPDEPEDLEGTANEGSSRA